ncbi:MAG: DNA repair protein RadC [Salinisphaera sp.]|jgi:DNA repair protein RadC|nr:DNA repair protein RadC [Salinisphaera sp.]
MLLSITPEESGIIQQAIEIIERGITDRDVLTDPAATRNYLRLQLAGLEHEIFGVIFLDNRNRVLGKQDLFRGTIDGSAVYPREVAKECLINNAAGVIFYHNHPSGVAEPSRADRDITRRLTEALALFDIRVLDHLIVGESTTSMAERGLI